MKEITFDNTTYYITDNSYRLYKDTFIELKKDHEGAKTQLGFLIEMETGDLDPNNKIEEHTFKFCIDILRKSRKLKVKKEKVKKERKPFKTPKLIRRYFDAFETTFELISKNPKFYTVLHWIFFAVAICAGLGLGLYAMATYEPEDNPIFVMVLILKLAASLFFLTGVMAPLIKDESTSAYSYDIENEYLLSNVYLMFMTLGLIISTILFYLT